MTLLYDGMLHTHSNAYGNFEKKLKKYKHTIYNVEFKSDI